MRILCFGKKSWKQLAREGSKFYAVIAYRDALAKNKKKDHPGLFYCKTTVEDFMKKHKLGQYKGDSF